MQSTIDNVCLKVYIYGHSEPQFVSKMLLQVSVRQLNNSMAIPLEEGGLNDARYSDNNIIISDSTLLSIFPPQINNISSWYKVMCGCEFCIYAKSIHSSLLSWRDCYSRNFNNIIKNAQKIRPGEKANRLFDTYKNYVIPHGRHIYAISDYMAMAKICEHPQSLYSLPHWKYVLRCCSNRPHIDITYQESDKNHSNTSPSIHFHIYHLITQCTVHQRHPIYEEKLFHLCFQDPATVTPAKLYTRKELVMM